MRKTAVILGICMAVAVLCATKPMHALAADNGSLHLTVSPLVITSVVNPGQIASTDLHIKNGGSQPETLKVSLMKFVAGQNGEPELETPAPGDSYMSWVSFSRTTFVADPGAWNSITVAIKLPASAAFDYNYAVLFTNANAPAGGSQQAALQGGVATLALIEAKVPGAKQVIGIVKFTSQKRAYEFLPAQFLVSVTNTGNVFGAPVGTIFITQGSKQVATISVNGTGGNVLPGSSRTFTASWSDGFPSYQPKVVNGQIVLASNGQPEQSLSWNFNNISHFRFGRYTATVVMAYDSDTGEVPLSATISFWVIPWRIILVVVVILGFIALGIWSAIHKVIRRLRAKPKAEKSNESHE